MAIAQKYYAIIAEVIWAMYLQVRNLPLKIHAIV